LFRHGVALDSQLVLEQWAGWRAVFLLGAPPSVKFKLPDQGGSATGWLEQQDDALFTSGQLSLTTSGSLPPPPFESHETWPVKQGAAMGGAVLALLAYLVGWLWLRKGLHVERRRAARGRSLLRLGSAHEVRFDAAREAMHAWALKLRQPQRVDANRLDIRKTTEATARQAGLFSGVYGIRRERRFLALVRRQSLQDHQAFISEMLVEELCRSGADVMAFRFDREAKLLRPYAPDVGDSQKRPVHDPRVLPEISQILAANELAECMLFCEPAALVDPLTGKLQSWVRRIVAAGHRCTVITIAPIDRWDPVHALLQAEGIAVVCSDPASLLALAQGNPKRPQVLRQAGGQGALQSDFYLGDMAPPPEDIASLCEAIRDELGYVGYRWVQACAIYPEIQWPLTHAVGALLVLDTRERADLLVRISELIWFRAAYMPDWLRAALIADLDERTKKSFRDFFWTVFDHVVEQKPLSLELVSPFRSKSIWLRLKRWLRIALALKARAAPGSQRDQLFVSFLKGREGGLALPIPGRTARALGAAIHTPTIVLASVCLFLAASSITYGTAAADGDLSAAVFEDAAIRFESGTQNLVVAGLDRTKGKVLVSAFANSAEGAKWSALPLDSPPARILLGTDGKTLVTDVDSPVYASIAWSIRNLEQASPTMLPNKRWLAAAPVALDETGFRMLDISKSSDGWVYQVIQMENYLGGWSVYSSKKVPLPFEPTRVALGKDAGLLMRPEGTAVIVHNPGGIRVGGSTDGILVAGTRSRIAWSANSAGIFAECSTQGTLLVWASQPTLRLIARRQMRTDFTCTAMALIEDGRHIAVGSQDGRVQLHDIVTGSVMELDRDDTQVAVADLSFAPDGLSLAAVHADLSIKTWNFKDGRKAAAEAATAAANAAAAAADAEAAANAASAAAAAASAASAVERPPSNPGSAAGPAASVEASAPTPPVQERPNRGSGAGNNTELNYNPQRGSRAPGLRQNPDLSQEELLELLRQRESRTSTAKIAEELRLREAQQEKARMAAELERLKAIKGREPVQTAEGDAAANLRPAEGAASGARGEKGLDDASPAPRSEQDGGPAFERRAPPSR
jgi:hypothetical protein